MVEPVIDRSTDRLLSDDGSLVVLFRQILFDTFHVARVFRGQIGIDQFVNAECDDITAPEAVFLDLSFADKDAVRTVEVFNYAAVFVGHNLRVMPADKFALDVNFIVWRTADNSPTYGEGLNR